MAIEETDRLGLPTYTSGTDAHPIREDFNTRMQLLDQIAAIVKEGPHEDRGLPQTWGRFWLSTDTRDLYFDRGNEWVLVSRIGAGGPGANVVIGASATEGSSDRAARADHTHNLPLATGSVPGAMSSADKTKLDLATSIAISERLVRRDASGRTNFNDPTSAAHAATKNYVDTQIGTRAPSSHSHNAADTTSGTFAAERLPAATPSAQGAMSAADKEKLDGARSDAVGDRLVIRTSNGMAHFADPTSGTHAANKQYVDSATSTGSVVNFRGNLTSSTHLDTVTGQGEYTTTGTSTVHPDNGYPIDGEAGVLSVRSSGLSILQEWTQTNGTPRRWIRTRNTSGTWFNWRELT